MTVRSERIREFLAEYSPEALLCDGLDDALVGTTSTWPSHNIVAVYDRDACVQVFMREGMDWTEAEEHMCFNVVGAYAGEHTPLFIVFHGEQE